MVCHLDARPCRVWPADSGRCSCSNAVGRSTYFTWLNRGKESICLDIKDPTDAALLRTMLAEVMHAAARLLSPPPSLALAATHL